ncbi:MAG: hypothetical protein PHQ60_05445 [Sideroxydans sp.]|nr:hypothetical protein [Sideroxydans sp.]
MLKSILKTFGYIVCLAWTASVCATGLGEINVSTYLGQPLKAEIDLVSVDRADRTGIVVKLASAEAFKNAGIDYPYSLPKLKFEVVNRDSGDPYVKVTSAQAINEPFVTLLVEATWSSGKLLREYTFLLDPVDFNVQAKAEVVKPIEPVVATPAIPASPAPAITPAAPVVTAPAPVTPLVAQPAAVEATQQEAAETTPPPSMEQPLAQPEAAPAAETVSGKAAEAANAADAIPALETAPEEVTVVRGDSLSKIALRVKPAEVSLDRMLVAMYRANTDAFVGHNMNRLKTGKIIRLPDAAELENVQQSEAVKEVHAHVVDWNAYRQQLASVRAEAREQAGRQESSGKITTAVTEKATVGKEAAKGVLKLSKGEAPGDKSAGGSKPAAQDKANAKAEEAIAKSKALKEVQERTALLEKNLKDMQRLAELKKKALTGQATSGVAAASSVAATAKPKTDVPKTVPPPKAAVETSLVDDVLQDPMLLAGVVVLLLIMGGAGYWLVRSGKLNFSLPKMPSLKRGKAKAAKTEEDSQATVKIAAPVVPSPDTGDFTHTAAVETAVTSHADEVDPIGEADLFLTFGRDAQAEAVLKEALSGNPGNVPVKLKLMSIYANRKDTNSFYTLAREIKDGGDDAAWNDAAAMGRELEPGNPFYGGDGSSSEQTTEVKPKVEDHAVDFDLGFGTTSFQASQVDDFMNTAVMPNAPHEQTTVLTADELRVSQETPMDFDVTGSHSENKSESGLEVNPMFNMDEMMFDITSSRKSMSASGSTATATTKPEEASIDDLIFDVTTTNQGQPAATAAAAVAAPVPAAEESMSFTLDFPTEFKAEPAPKVAAPVDIGLSEISLNLDSFNAPAAAPSSSSSGAAKDERWQEVATKLDLAKAYQEMGDANGAKEILEEVLRDGDEQQRASAQTMLKQL